MRCKSSFLIVDALFCRCIIKRQKNIKDHWPGCVYANQTLNSSTANVKADGKIICKGAPLFEHDPAQVHFVFIDCPI